MAKHCLFALCVCCALALVPWCGHRTVYAQGNGYKATLKPMEVLSKLPGDKACPYFLLSNLGYLKDPEVGFQYTLPSGGTESDVIEAGKGSVSIDASKDVPAVEKAASPDGPTWTILISSSAYDANKECLAGLPKK